jgi:hypothetical protein
VLVAPLLATSATVGAGGRAEPPTDLLAARSRKVGVATETLLTKAEQVSDDGACACRFTSKSV